MISGFYQIFFISNSVFSTLFFSYFEPLPKIKEFFIIQQIAFRPVLRLIRIENPSVQHWQGQEEEFVVKYSVKQEFILFSSY